MEIVSQSTDCIDLHIHSTASDGSLSPVEIIEAARKIGLRAISITDHDTLEGSAEALQCVVPASLEILPGVEMSVGSPSGSMHILGYLMRLDALSLSRTLAVVQEARTERNRKIVKNLQGLGIAVTYEDIIRIAGRGQVGRPHFARFLVLKGAAHSFDEAFNRFLGRGRPAYAPRYRLPAAEAIAVILEAGGVPVLAHPSSLHASDETALERILLDLKEVGLQGVEVYYPDHDPERRALYEALALRHGLALTGGTDFHGMTKPAIHMGVGKGDLRIPYRLVEALKRRALAS